MTRIGTGLSAKVRTYGVNTTSTVFRLLESAVPQGSQIVNDVSGVPIGTRVDLDSGPVRTLDSAYVQGVTIYNESTVAGEFIYVAGAEYAGVAGAVGSVTAWKILPGEALAFDVRDGTGLCICFLNSVNARGTNTARIVGN